MVKNPIIKKGYKQTEIGIIPEDWEVKQINSETDLLTGYPFPSNKYSVTGIRLLRGSNIKRGKTDWTDEITQYWEKITPELRSYILNDGDIVIAMDGSLVGRSFARLSKKDLPALLLQRVTRIRSNKIDMGYLKEFICSDYFTKYCDTVKTSSAIPHISPIDIRQFKIPIPPNVSEQSAIATVLSDTDTLIEHLDTLITKKKAIKQGTMQQLLNGKKRLPGFSGEWGEKKLGEVFSLSATYSKSKLVDTGGDYLIMDMGSVSSSGKMIASKRTYTDADLLKIGDLVMPKDDIGGGNIIGKVVYIDQDNKYILGDHVYKLTTKNLAVDTLFYSYLINSNIVSSELKKKVAGSAQLGLGRRSVEDQIVKIPLQKNEQSTIASILFDMDREIESLEHKRDKYRDIKQGMMQQLLTGNIRIYGNK